MPNSLFFVKESELHPEDADDETEQKMHHFQYDDYGKPIQIDFDSGIINLERITPKIYRCFFDDCVYFLIYDENLLSNIIRYDTKGGAGHYGEKKVSPDGIVITERRGSETFYTKIQYIREDGKIVDVCSQKYTIDD